MADFQAALVACTARHHERRARTARMCDTVLFTHCWARCDLSNLQDWATADSAGAVTCRLLSGHPKSYGCNRPPNGGSAQEGPGGPVAGSSTPPITHRRACASSARKQRRQTKDGGGYVGARPPLDPTRPPTERPARRAQCSLAGRRWLTGKSNRGAALRGARAAGGAAGARGRRGSPAAGAAARRPLARAAARAPAPNEMLNGRLPSAARLRRGGWPARSWPSKPRRAPGTCCVSAASAAAAAGVPARTAPRARQIRSAAADTPNKPRDLRGARLCRALAERQTHALARARARPPHTLTLRSGAAHAPHAAQATGSYVILL